MSAANAYNAVSYDEAERTFIGRLEEGITNYRLNQIKLETHGFLTGKLVAYGYMSNVRAGQGSQSPKKKEYDDKFKEEYVKRLLYERMNINNDYNDVYGEIEQEYIQYLDSLDEERRKNPRPTSTPAPTSQSRPAPTSTSTSASSTLPTFYRRLQVPINANTNRISKQYKKLALKYHPDKGGNTAKFQKLQEAYATLKNNTLRRNYNRTHGIRRGGRRRFARTSKRRA